MEQSKDTTAVGAAQAAQHTETPWAIEGRNKDGGYKISRLNRNDGTPFTSYWLADVGNYTDNDKANAEFIVRAVNHHDEMVGVLQDWVVFCDLLEGKEATRTSAEHMEAVRARARAVLAKVYAHA